MKLEIIHSSLGDLTFWGFFLLFCPLGLSQLDTDTLFQKQLEITKYFLNSLSLHPKELLASKEVPTSI